MLTSEGTNAGLAVNGFARSALASLVGPARPLTAALRRGPQVTGNPAQITSRDMLTVGYAVYAFMRKLTAQYTGGYCTFFELSNGGFYMAPECETTFDICVDGNGFEGTMSADAAGITACLFALSHLPKCRGSICIRSLFATSRASIFCDVTSMEEFMSVVLVVLPDSK